MVCQPRDRLLATGMISGSTGIVAAELARALRQPIDLTLHVGSDREAAEPGSGPGGHPVIALPVGGNRIEHGRELLSALWPSLPAHSVSTAFYRSYYEQAARQIGRERPDIIHLHTFLQHAPLLRHAGGAARLVLHLHHPHPLGLDPPAAASGTSGRGCRGHLLRLPGQPDQDPLPGARRQGGHPRQRCRSGAVCRGGRQPNPIAAKPALCRAVVAGEGRACARPGLQPGDRAAAGCVAGSARAARVPVGLDPAPVRRDAACCRSRWAVWPQPADRDSPGRSSSAAAAIGSRSSACSRHRRATACAFWARCRSTRCRRSMRAARSWSYRPSSRSRSACRWRRPWPPAARSSPAAWEASRSW